jgi:hypothetical protein
MSEVEIPNTMEKEYLFNEAEGKPGVSGRSLGETRILKRREGEMLIKIKGEKGLLSLKVWQYQNIRGEPGGKAVP